MSSQAQIEELGEELRNLRVQHAGDEAELGVLRERDAIAAGLRNELRASKLRHRRAADMVPNQGNKDRSINAIEFFDDTQSKSGTQTPFAPALDHALSSAAALDNLGTESEALSREVYACVHKIH